MHFFVEALATMDSLRGVGSDRWARPGPLRVL